MLQTADLDNQGILQLQDNAMRQQDAELEDLERTVNSTKVCLLHHSIFMSGLSPRRVPVGTGGVLQGCTVRDSREMKFRLLDSSV
jgi:hypothetical protein